MGRIQVMPFLFCPMRARDKFFSGSRNTISGGQSRNTIQRVASDRAGVGISADKWGLGADKRVSGDVLGVDLSVVRVSDLSVIPSATSSNQVVIIDTSDGVDGDAVIKKSGIFFNFSFDRTEGPTQALRNLFDLAAIELIGKLMKVPYWQCLDIPGDSESIKQEISQWMHIFEGDKVLVRYVRRILYIKGLYNADNEDTTFAFQQAVKSYQQSIGITPGWCSGSGFCGSIVKWRGE